KRLGLESAAALLPRQRHDFEAFLFLQRRDKYRVEVGRRLGLVGRRNPDRKDHDAASAAEAPVSGNIGRREKRSDAGRIRAGGMHAPGKKAERSANHRTANEGGTGEGAHELLDGNMPLRALCWVLIWASAVSMLMKADSITERSSSRRRSMAAIWS